MADLAARINRAYGAAEAALWLPGKERISVERVREIVAAGEMAVARVDAQTVGSVRARLLDERTGYFGLLAVEPGAQGRGAGSALVGFAERLARETGAKRMELRLLLPSEGGDAGKLWLGGWYERLGYRVVGREDFGESHPDSVAAMRTPLEILTYRKRL